MQAALFTMRCFDTAETEFPFFVSAFIVYGTSESIALKAERLYAEHLFMCERPCGRIHKTGPLPINRFMINDSSGYETDWSQVARRIESEQTRRPTEQGACIFQEIRRGPIIRVEEAGQTATIEFNPDLDKELSEKVSESFSLSRPKRAIGPTFLFIGSRYEKDAAQRTGEVFLVEASNLEEAADACSAVLGRARNVCIHVEWCCPVHKADP